MRRWGNMAVLILAALGVIAINAQPVSADEPEVFDSAVVQIQITVQPFAEVELFDQSVTISASQQSVTVLGKVRCNTTVTLSASWIQKPQSAPNPNSWTVETMQPSLAPGTYQSIELLRISGVASEPNHVFTIYTTAVGPGESAPSIPLQSNEGHAILTVSMNPG